MGNGFEVVLEEWKRFSFPDIVDRYVKPRLSRDVTAIIGPRRAGKTYLLLLLAKKALEEYGKDNVIYINFDDERIRGEHFENLFVAYHKLFNPDKGKRIVLLLDEIQNVENWDGWLRTLHNQQKYYIVVSGSSSKLLSREISTSLRGRYISYTLLPFSFGEFLKLKNVRFLGALLPEDRGVISRNLEEYIRFGGFPEVVLSGDILDKKKKLQSLYETIFYKDVVERFRIRNYGIAKDVLEFFLTNYSNRMTITKIHNFLNSAGKKISKKSVWRYFQNFQDAFSIFSLNPHTLSKRKQIILPRKIYSVDTGISLMLSSREDRGRLIENVVFLELVRRSEKEMSEIYYHLENGNEMADFVVKKGSKVGQLIQVCYDIQGFDTREREIGSLLKSSKELKCNNLLIITWDYEGELKEGGRKIVFEPLWKWLLER